MFQTIQPLERSPGSRNVPEVWDRQGTSLPNVQVPRSNGACRNLPGPGAPQGLPHQLCRGARAGHGLRQLHCSALSQHQRGMSTAGQDQVSHLKLLLTAAA